jgi:acetyl esterase/lipase
MSLDQADPRLALNKAFAHVAELRSQADLAGVVAPVERWVAVVRHLMRRYGDVGTPPSLEGIRIRPVVAGGVPAEWVQAEEASDAHRLVYLHGGAWAGGDAKGYRGMTSTLARLTGSSVLVVNYRLAPEHRFPAGLDDCIAALAWAGVNGPSAVGNADEVGRDPAAQVTLAGDSAGGNLAAAAVIDAICEGRRIPDRLALMSATLDNLPYPNRVGANDAIITPGSLATSLANYMSQRDVAYNPRISPVFADNAVLARFPPTLLQASSIETLVYDAHKFAERLEQAGARSVLSIWPDLPHAWHAFLGLFPQALEALQEVADFLRPRPRSQ